ncbi:MAG TPA: MaoC family dehydratase [Pyrinomonadaceae bacterium]|jgi:acyl dehydratase|nr:MaoC family dehydratase [Pyrinomonadaceae bacterium]HEU4874327.1 MaoC family dehydratase [Pyrinomonadaceae bacterium]
MNFTVGDSAEIKKTIEQADIDAFAEVTGDHNPVHVDEEFAKTTRFGRRIAHGMLTASLISSVLANKLPGEGSVYLNQTLQFVAPVFPGDEITARVTVKEIREDKPILKLETICMNQRDEIVIRGEATVLAADKRR